MMLYPIHAFNLNILKIRGRSDLFLKLEVIKKVIAVVSISITFQFGVLGLVWSSVITSFSALLVNMYYSSKLINYPIYNQIKDIYPTFILALLTAFCINMLIINLSQEPYFLRIFNFYGCRYFYIPQFKLF